MRTEPARHRFPSPRPAEQSWALRLMSAGAGEDATPDDHLSDCRGPVITSQMHRMPRRVTDGLRAETVARRLWCLAAESLEQAHLLDEVRAVLAAHHRTVALLATGEWPRSHGSVPAVCDHYGLTPAEIVVVYANFATDSVALPAWGARVLCVHPTQRPPRGALAVASVAELDGLLRGSAPHVSASTYHEV